MSFLDQISVVIPVREGSSRIPEKIFLPFGNGMNLLEWKVSQIKQIHPWDKIFLSSNSERVKEIAQKMSIGYMPRADELCKGHTATFSEVILGVVRELPTDYFAWVTAVVPLMRPTEYLEAFHMFEEHVVQAGTHDSLAAVNLMKEYLWANGQPLNYCADRNHTISQELPDIFRVTNGLYMRAKQDTLKEGYFLGPKPFLHKVEKISGIDIDELEDYNIANQLKALYESRENAGDH